MVMKQWFALVSMMRLGNAVMAAIGILVGYLFSREVLVFPELTLLILAGMLSLGFGNVINDLFDIETDSISHPTRPLVTGLVSPRRAKIFAVLLALFAIGCGFSLSILHGLAVIFPIALLWLYASQLKGVPLVGNAVVGILVAYTLLFGALG